VVGLPVRDRYKTTELKVRMHLGGRIQPSQSAQFEKPDILEPESIPGL
jgi:hypothetical protein